MALREHIKAGFVLPDFMVTHYLMDLSEEELMVRPISKMNHFKWQFGHLISGENFHMNELKIRPMPELPESFAETFNTENAVIDDPAFFPSKEEMVETMTVQRKGTLDLLDSLSDDQLGEKSPESLNYFGPTVGSVFSGELTHWMLHVGQLTVIRKHLGKETF